MLVHMSSDSIHAIPITPVNRHRVTIVGVTVATTTIADEVFFHRADHFRTTGGIVGRLPNDAADNVGYHKVELPGLGVGEKQLVTAARAAVILKSISHTTTEKTNDDVQSIGRLIEVVDQCCGWIATTTTTSTTTVCASTAFVIAATTVRPLA
jgi:hypothetical protein